MRKTPIISVAFTLLLVSMGQSVVAGEEVNAASGKKENVPSCEETFDVSKMNACAQKAYEASEKWLEKTYMDVIHSFYLRSEKSRFERVHRKWITFRQTYCEFATHASRKAPGFRFEKYDCLDRVTKQYIQNLERYIEFNADA
jgi:uncharacterized protein YecT (DUF1311 family)